MKFISSNSYFFHINKLLLILVISLLCLCANAKELLDSNPFYISKEKLANIERNISQIQSGITADLYDSNHFKSEEGKTARKLLLRFADGDEAAGEKAIKLLKSAADKQDAHAMAWLGMLNQIGAGSLEVDLKKGFQFFKRAADLGDPFGLYTIGFFHERGRYGLEKSREKALKYYDMSNDAGGHWTLNWLGDSYRNGNDDLNIEADKEYAVELYKKAIEAGSLNAKVSLIQLYYAGDGTKLPEEARLVLITTYGKQLCSSRTVFGAKGCYFDAIAEHSEIKLLEVDTPEKRNRMIDGFHKAYKQGKGLAEAYASLALIVSSDPTYDFSIKQINHFFKLGCVSFENYIPFEPDDIGRACVAMSAAYAYGNKKWNNEIVDYNLARNFVEIGVNNDYGEAISLSSYYYQYGVVYDKNLEKAFDLAQKAANDHSDANGFQILANYYAKGELIKKSLQTSHELNGKAAMKGLPLAMEKYAIGFVADPITEELIQNPDYESCFLWGNIANFRDPKFHKPRDICGSFLGKKKKSELIKKAKEMEHVIPNY